MQLRIDALDCRGRGTADYQGHTVVCEGSLPGELVRVSGLEQRRRRLVARDVHVTQPVTSRIKPVCRYFGACGGCQLQHASYATQLAYKESCLRQAFLENGALIPDAWLPILTGAPLAYRRRVRLAVRRIGDAPAIVGFRRKSHSYVLDISTCPVLVPRLNSLLGPLHELVNRLGIRAHLPQIEMCCGDRDIAVIIRHLRGLPQSDLEQLRSFASLYTVMVYTQAAGPDSIRPLFESQSMYLGYSLPVPRISLSHRANDFVQANSRVNAMLVQRVLEIMAPTRQDDILELYCGIGNFSLPLARHARRVTGVDVHQGLVERARTNAAVNNLYNLQFQQADLDAWQLREHYQKVLLDPPREGAIQVVKQLAAAGVNMIVYTSCMPRTLARDARYLVRAAGYRLTQAGVVDMFPQTRHVESIAVFVK